MNQKNCYIVRYKLTSTIVNEGILCRRFGVDKLEDADDSLLVPMQRFISELVNRVKKDKRAAYIRARKASKALTAQFN